MSTTHTLDNLKHYHNEAIQFFGSELMLLKEAIPKITDKRLEKAAILLISCGQTGAALLQLAHQTDRFISEAIMLARSFMEKITNFCYVCVCDEREYRAYILHPVYKHYHNTCSYKMEDGIDLIAEKVAERKEKQKRLKEIPIVQEALEMFSDKKSHLNWTKKSMTERIEVIKNWGKCMDAFFTINKFHYYSDASEALHGSLYGCIFDTGIFNPGFDPTEKEEINKKSYKNSTCILLHLGMLIHESLNVISYSDNIKEIWDCSYKNRNHALNLLFHVLEIDPEASLRRIEYTITKNQEGVSKKK